MSQSTKTLRQPRSGRSRVGGTSQPVTGTASASALQSVFDRALQMGRFRFGWSADQRSFLRSEIALWSSDHCLQLGEEITGVSDRLVWELLPLEQAALSRFRVQLLDQVVEEESVSEPLYQALSLLRVREFAQQREYEQLAVVVQSVTQGRDRSLHNAWFLDALTTRVAGRWDSEQMKVGLLALAHMLLPPSTG